MPYTDASSLALFLPANQGLPILTGSSYPNMDQAASMIAAFSVEVDGAALAAGYSVPVDQSATYAWALLNRYTSLGAGAQALRTLLPHLSGGSNDTSNLASNMERQYRLALNDLRQGNILLSDAPRDGGTERSMPRSNFTEDPALAPGPDIDVDWIP